MKVLGVFAGLLGSSMIIFAVLTWRELRGAAFSELAPSADSMPLTRFVYPRFFDAGNAGTKPAKPAEVARAAFTRVYIIIGGSFALVVAGIIMLVLPQRPRTRQDNS